MRVRSNFIQNFWMGDHFAEYVHPERGRIDLHGLSDTDWAALAFGAMSPEQQRVLWPRLQRETRFYYGGMPTGIATEPEKYQDWEFSYPDREDLAAMGRVWYVESQARAHMGDADGLLESIRRVAAKGRESGYYWRERYNSKGAFGVESYTEYPANLIRIVQRFLLGLEFGLDGAVTIAPTVTADYWERGFGQVVKWRDRALDYRMQRGEMVGTYTGREQPLAIRFEPGNRREAAVRFNGRSGRGRRLGEMVFVTLPESSVDHPCQFEIRCVG